MGKDFNFNEWCDSWLKTSGVNILEPAIEYNDDFSIKSFAIKQSCDLRGKNILRQHKLNIAFYDAEFKAHVVNDVVLSNKGALNQVVVDFQGPVKAVIINHDDHAFAKVRFDQRTLDTFESDLSKIDDYLDRASVWRHLWILVQDCQMSSAQFFDFVVKQLPLETVEQSIVATLMQLRQLIAYYLPVDQIKEARHKMFGTLYEMLS